MGNIPLLITSVNYSFCVSEEKAYIYSYNRNLWEFDPLTDKWAQISKFWGPQRNKTSLVYLNNQIFMIGGEYIDVMTQNLKDYLNNRRHSCIFQYQNHIVAGLGYAVVGNLDIYEPDLYYLTP